MQELPLADSISGWSTAEVVTLAERERGAPDDEDALVQLSGSLSQRMLLIQVMLALVVPIWRVVEVVRSRRLAQQHETLVDQSSWDMPLFLAAIMHTTTAQRGWSTCAELSTCVRMSHQISLIETQRCFKPTGANPCFCWSL